MCHDLSVPHGDDLQPLETSGAIWEAIARVPQTVKNLPAMRETQVPSLGREDPLEEGMATYSSTLAWGTPWTEEPGGLQFIGY